MSGSKFVYVIYIRTTREKLWDALRKPEFTKQYWNGAWQESDWKVGASWKMMIPEGRLADSGEVLEYDPPNRLVLSWQNQFRPELTEEGFSRAIYTLEQIQDAVKLTITHEIGVDNSKLIEAVSNGWPAILSSLKTFLEVGDTFEKTKIWPKRPE
jgi:uncharacterized protein YndB with AHSA1/START domain